MTCLCMLQAQVYIIVYKSLKTCGFTNLKFLKAHSNTK